MQRSLLIIAVLGAYARAGADIQYTFQERTAHAFAAHNGVGSNESTHSAPDFGPFNDTMEVDHTISIGTAYAQTLYQSNLGPASISARLAASTGVSGNHGGAPSATASSILRVEFDLAAVSGFMLTGQMVIGSSTDAVTFVTGHVTLATASATIFDVKYTPAHPFIVNFSGANAISGQLAAGHYTLTASGEANTIFRDSDTSFTLTIPSPGGVSGLAILTLFASRRRRLPKDQ